MEETMRNEGLSRRGFLSGLFLRRRAERPDASRAGEPTASGPVRASGRSGASTPGVMAQTGLSLSTQVSDPGGGRLLAGLLADSAALARSSAPPPPASSFLDTLLGLSPAPTTSRPRPALPLLRPPGAVQEEAFLAGCTRCGECVSACPHGSITLAPSRFRDAAGTPIIDPSSAPCWMCADTPCITACEPGVLTRAVPIKLGEARIQPHNCLSWQRSFCSVCVERCPVPGAIVLDAGRPRVVAETCTGCGICQHMCPAPVNAIMVMPMPVRPLPTGDKT